MNADQRGQSTVELALCLPLVVIVLAIVVEVGAIAIDHVKVWHAAREAARVAAVDSDLGAIQKAAEDSGLKSPRIVVEPEELYRRYGEPVTVRVEHSPAGRIPIVGELFNRITLDAAATMRIEQP